ncbi:helix-turn-helix domain-containing protein [Dactylosporangium sp. NPDC000521]|uniref:helix-turn-helix domain-containing protein n=1 Tax=Dactylosporangium sp. NPDC000521 TaxID=3363975 RepID=UPI0036CD891B
MSQPGVPPDIAPDSSQVAEAGGRWPKTVTQVLARQLKAWREQRKISANELSRRTAELGFEVPRSVIANIETGRRDSIGVNELLILAAALDIPPILLITPIGVSDSMEILPDVTVSPWLARGWIMGTRPIEFTGSSLVTWRDSRRSIVLYDIHRLLVQEYLEIQGRIKRVSSRTDGAADYGVFRGGEDRQSYLQALVRDLARSLHSLRTHRMTIESEGFVAPDLPLALQTLLREVAAPSTPSVEDEWGTEALQQEQVAADEMLLLLREIQGGGRQEDR